MEIQSYGKSWYKCCGFYFHTSDFKKEEVLEIAPQIPGIKISIRNIDYIQVSAGNQTFYVKLGGFRDVRLPTKNSRSFRTSKTSDLEK